MNFLDYRKTAAKSVKHKINKNNYLLVINNSNLFTSLYTSVKAGNKGSSDMFNKLIEAISDELLIQETALEFIELDYQYWNEQRLAQLRSLGRKVRELKTKTEDLILVADKTDGFYYTISDDFNDLSKIEIEPTTASVNTSIGFVMSSKDDGKITQNTEIVDIVPLITFDAISDSVPEFAEDLTGYSLPNIFDKNLDSAWIHKITLGIPSLNPVVGTLTLDYQDIINATNLEIIGANNYLNISYKLDILVSDDSVEWKEIIASYNFNGSAIIPLPIQEFRFMKIFLSLKNPSIYENNRPVYQFHLKEIRLFKQKFNGYSVLYTKPITLLDEEEKEVSFSSVALKTCEILPENTNINCFIAFGNNDTFTNFQTINPLNRSTGQILHVNSALIRSITSNLLDNSLKFPYNYNNNSTLNFSVTSDISLSDLKLIRDVGNWSVNNNWYTLVFYLSSSTELDFRTWNVYLNGKFKNSIETYEEGFYTIRINDSSILDAIKNYITTKTLYLGGYLATLLDISEFLKIAEDNYNYFAVTPTKTTDNGIFTANHIMIKELEPEEAVVVVSISANDNTTANQVKLKFELLPDTLNNLTPILDSYQLKINRVI